MRRAAVIVKIPPRPLPHVDVTGKIESGRHDAGDRVRLAVELELPADERRVRVVPRAPESIADDGHEPRAERGAGRETRSDLRRNAEHLEKIRAGLDRLHANR